MRNCLKIKDLIILDFLLFSMRCECFEKSADEIENEGVVGAEKAKDKLIRVDTNPNARPGGTDAVGNRNWLPEIMFKYPRSV